VGSFNIGSDFMSVCRPLVQNRSACCPVIKGEKTWVTACTRRRLYRIHLRTSSPKTVFSSTTRA
jgi:hypothetical protein